MENILRKKAVTNICIKITAVLVSSVFFFNSIVLAWEPSGITSKNDIVPTSRFSPIRGVETLTSGSEEKSFTIEEHSRNDAVWAYLNNLILDVLSRYGHELSPRGIARLIEKHTAHLALEGIALEEIYKRGDSYYIPVVDGHGARGLLRYAVSGPEAKGVFSVEASFDGTDENITGSGPAGDRENQSWEYKGRLFDTIRRQIKGAYLKIPSPRGHIPDIESVLDEIIETYCKPFEEDAESVLPDEKIGWRRINGYMRKKGLDPFDHATRPIVHIIDLESSGEASRFGFPVKDDSREFSDQIPVVSYVSEKDGKPHIFMTSDLYDDYLEISHLNQSVSQRNLRTIRFAEILDHEQYENSGKLLEVKEEARHHLASVRADKFRPKGQKISCFHKWCLDNLALTEKGREFIMLLLDEYRPEAEESAQKDYEESFYQYAKDILPRKKYSRKVQRAAHHLLRVYLHGDREAFERLSALSGLSAEKLEKQIEKEAQEHIFKSLVGFRPETEITETSETDVTIDPDKGIVIKKLKKGFAPFIFGVLLKSEKGQSLLKALLEAYYDPVASPETSFRGAEMEATVNTVQALFVSFAGENRTGKTDLEDPAVLARGITEDYISILENLESYNTARERLGGLIADFAVNGYYILQEKVTPITVYLQELIAEKGQFAGLKDTSFENKTKIAWDILERYLECITEIAKRGALVNNVKLTNFGVKENGEVVLFDLGISTLSWMDKKTRLWEVARDAMSIRLISDLKRLQDLNADFIAEETGIVYEWKSPSEAERLQNEFARTWLEMISARSLAEKEPIDVDLYEDGRAFVDDLMKAVPQTTEEARKQWRRTTFVASEIAEEEMLYRIMEEIADSEQTSGPAGKDPEEGPEASSGGVSLRIPMPGGMFPGYGESVKKVIRDYCRPVEDEQSSVLPAGAIRWQAINVHMTQKGLKPIPENERPVVHVIDVTGDKGENLKGFPIEEADPGPASAVPVVSYISGKDGKVHIFMTAGFYDDYMQVSHLRPTPTRQVLQDIRMAEIIDHEVYENSTEALSMPAGERHRSAAARARHFIPRGEKISSFHKWVLDNMALTEEGIEHLLLLLDENRRLPAEIEQRKYENNFREYARSVIPRQKFSKSVQRTAHHIYYAYRHGDLDSFEKQCFESGIFPVLLDERIQRMEKKHVIKAVSGFDPDIVIRETNETDVE
ncbi:MAG: hypothetical protein GF408_04545, partial [Candidatus Omnitrophica bacterium]|nr:hypothetical protein [Candidatus Omnitrophota bacterium]